VKNYLYYIKIQKKYTLNVLMNICTNPIPFKPINKWTNKLMRSFGDHFALRIIRIFSEKLLVQ